MNKNEVIETAIYELRLAQTEDWGKHREDNTKGIRLPPTLPMGDGRQLHATDDLLALIPKYSNFLLDNKSNLRSLIKIDELREIVKLAFGQTLAKVDLDDQTTQELIVSVKKEIDSNVQSAINLGSEEIEIVLGCNLLESETLYPITIGPVTFQTRLQWLSQALESEKISKTSARRFKKAWGGGKLRERKYSRDYILEKAIHKSIGTCPIVCTVQCMGLSPKMAEEKSLLAARLSMGALSLMWIRPSRGLEWMNLLYDGPVYDRAYVLFGKKDRFATSNSISQLPMGFNADDEFSDQVIEYKNIFDLLGSSIENHVQPMSNANRPNIMRALFLSLFWFYQACRETSDQAATIKFSASLDALADGKKIKGIANLIEARVGHKQHEMLMKDGRTTDEVLRAVYDAGRSRLIHGTSEDFSHDWSKTRSTAESVARLCLIQTCEWLSSNPHIDNAREISKINSILNES